MSIRTRLIFLLVAFCALVAVGRLVTGDFGFLLNQFWFTAGFFLLLLLSLIDQPHFSKDANIFVNATTAWISLFLVQPPGRNAVWWAFFGWAAYLIVSSYLLMWLRTRKLQSEPEAVQVISRVNREIGRPEALFSAFFLWGCIQQFGTGSFELGALFLFWAVFMILNLPALAVALETVFGGSKKVERKAAGTLDYVISPRIAAISFGDGLPVDLEGRIVHLKSPKNDVVAEAVVVDDRIVAGKRIGRLAITTKSESWSEVGAAPGGTITIELQISETMERGNQPISVVDSGSEIGKIIFYVHPNQELQAGEVLWVQKDKKTRAFYQVISAQVCQSPLPDGNFLHTVKVTAGQLGVWDEKRSRFEPITWVAPAGELVRRCPTQSQGKHSIPDGNEPVGRIPNSDFPVHVSVADAITHNTAIIGVTGSGKSYLAFHLIEAMVRCKIKVLILDLSRQHDLYLTQHGPTALKAVADIKPWLDNESLIGIHQFGVDYGSYPKITADFVTAVFEEMSKTKLERGKDIPARLCVVFEEAHSLIPEWNQVANQSDTQQVNKTARVILQGRKFGMGALIISQRTANVTKTILNQCNTIFALQSFDQTGLDFLRNYMGEEYSHAISTLPSRHAILVGKASSSARPLLMLVDDMTNRWQAPEDEPAAAAPPPPPTEAV
jgi:hypothetical protein